MTYLFTQNDDWNSDNLQRIYEECEKIAVEELKLDPYPMQLEIVNSSVMLDLYSSIALPTMYNHWSFGKKYIIDKNKYDKGITGLALEIIANTNPSLTYLMDQNTITQQCMVIAHCFGHSHIFKNNINFQQHSDASSIVDYLVFAKNYIAKCEERYGVEAVEKTLDACHSLQDFGIFHSKKQTQLSIKKELEKQREKEEARQKNVNVLWDTLLKENNPTIKFQYKTYPLEKEENILYFIEKNSPKLESWQREIVRIVRKIAQYFKPQRETKTIHEGGATYSHYYIMNRLWEKNLITSGSMMEYIKNHSAVVAQFPFDSKYYSGFNPYALGFDIIRDIKRICENPNDEDKSWFPKMAGSNDFIYYFHDFMNNYKDQSMIMQYLSPKVIRDWKLFQLKDDRNLDFHEIGDIHNEEGYKHVRKTLSSQYDISQYRPELYVYNVDLKGDRKLYIRHEMKNKMGLKRKSAEKVLYHLKYLWGYDVSIQSYDGDRWTKTY